MRLATADIKGAYMQSGSIKRDIYMRPPREWKGTRGSVWKLTKLVYGIAESGRQWATAVETWMLDDCKFERVSTLSQLFLKRDHHNKIAIVIAKVVDDFLVGGSLELINQFMDKLQRRFDVGKIRIDNLLLFNGCEITQQEHGNITMSMNSYMSKLKLIDLSICRKKQLDADATPEELAEYQNRCVILVWLGNGVLPQASFVSSTMQQFSGRLKVGNLREANSMIKELYKLRPSITFLSPLYPVKSVEVLFFSDASFNVSSKKDYGQTGLIGGLRLQVTKGDDIFHIIEWKSHKQDRVTFSSYGAEILACSESDDYAFYFKQCFGSLYNRQNIRNRVVVDSHALFDTITTSHEAKDMRLRQTVVKIRNSFESRELDILQWINGPSNVADALTKRNTKLFKDLNDIALSGLLISNLENGQEHDSSSWK